MPFLSFNQQFQSTEEITDTKWRWGQFIAM